MRPRIRCYGIGVIVAIGTLAAATRVGAEDSIDSAPFDWRARSAAAAPDGRCGTPDFGPAELPRGPGKHDRVGPSATVTTINVAFHVISKEVIKDGVRSKVGDVSTSKLDAQISVMNAAFAPAGLRFKKLSVTRVTNNTWFAMTMGSSAETAAKSALAKDPARTLNIYVCGIPNGHLGWAYYPWSFSASSSMHGLVVLYTTLPGGSLSGYNKGDTAVHEIGHYFGLYHTFEKGCASTGDQVVDTPAEATPAYSCGTRRDTCPAPGLDPIRNYMDYGTDTCMIEFTPGQNARMGWALATYKGGLAAPATLPAAGATPTGKPPVRIVSVTPNPFNPTTTIEFALAHDSHVLLRIFDVGGRAVATPLDGNRAAGTYRVAFDGRGMASGVYFAVLQAGNARVQERLVMLK
jgi:hypothetical protein